MEFVTLKEVYFHLDLYLLDHRVHLVEISTLQMYEVHRRWNDGIFR